MLYRHISTPKVTHKHTQPYMQHIYAHSHMHIMNNTSGSALSSWCSSVVVFNLSKPQSDESLIVVIYTRLLACVVWPYGENVWCILARSSHSHRFSHIFTTAFFNNLPGLLVCNYRCTLSYTSLNWNGVTVHIFVLYIPCCIKSFIALTQTSPNMLQ